MLHRHDLGRPMFALSGILLGCIGLWWRDFAGVWQPLDNLGDFNRPLVAMLYAIVFLAAGAASVWRASAGFALLVLALLHLLAALGWIPRAIGHNAWTGLFEMLSLTIAGVVGFASLNQPRSWASRTVQIGRVLFAICLLVFGISHFFFSAETAQMVPGWLPGGQLFWAYATGAVYILAGVAIAVDYRGALAAYVTVAMIILIQVMVWLPMLIAKQENFTWSGNAITFAIAAATWVVGDAIAAPANSGAMKT